MGAWNYGPFDNDCAGDFLDEVKACRNLTAVLDNALDSKFSDERRAAANYILSLDGMSLPNIKQYVDKSQQVLSDILQDNEWIGSWDNPDTIRRVIKEELEEVKSFR